MTDDADRIPGIVNVAHVAAQPTAVPDLLGNLRRALEAIRERDRLTPGPAAGEELTVAEFGDLMRRGPWPRRVAVSPATAEQWRSDATATLPPSMLGVPVELDELVRDGVVRIVLGSEAAERAALVERMAFRSRLPGGPDKFLRGVTGA